MNENVKRCSVCFGKFMHNHTPQEFKEPDGSVRLMHKVCKQNYERDLNTHHWPGVKVVRPPRDD